MVENDELKGTELEGEDQVEDAPSMGMTRRSKAPRRMLTLRTRSTKAVLLRRGWY